MEFLLDTLQGCRECSCLEQNDPTSKEMQELHAELSKELSESKFDFEERQRNEKPIYDMINDLKKRASDEELASLEQLQYECEDLFNMYCDRINELLSIVAQNQETIEWYAKKNGLIRDMLINTLRRVDTNGYVNEDGEVKILEPILPYPYTFE